MTLATFTVQMSIDSEDTGSLDMALYRLKTLPGAKKVQCTGWIPEPRETRQEREAEERTRHIYNYSHFGPTVDSYFKIRDCDFLGEGY